jgi:RNA polymerase I-specific transcription initiation factor RRN5
MADIPSEQDSASAYENSESEGSVSDVGKVHRSHASSNNRARNRPQSQETNRDVGHGNEVDGLQEESIIFHNDSSSDHRMQEKAREWAANFQPPPSARDIKTPPRHSTIRRKRKLQQTAPKAARLKRLQLYYNSDYRDALNIDINDAVRKSTPTGQTSLETTQMGASIWTTAEKVSFFTALERLGRSDLRGIAGRIGTKSVLEVHEFVRLLDEGNRLRDERGKSMLGSEFLPDMPASFEISEECCAILERAGDAVASHQQEHEAMVEKEKWGDCWLVDETVSRQLAKHIVDGEEDEGFREVLPAANLFDLKKWIQLSQGIFMNSAVKENNWQALAEDYEEPAIRATALEDFHSLAVGFTKRLISTTLFCTMSRQRATSKKTIKNGDITRDDVDAAVQILGVKPDSYDFWVKCPRKCNLSIIDTEESDGDDDPLSYDEVEEVLRRSQRRGSRSRSESRSVQPEYQTDSSSSDSASNCPVDPSEGEKGAQPSTSDSSNDGITDMSDNKGLSREEIVAKRLRDKEEAEEALEHYLDACDMDASRTEEARLWAMLEQEPPFELSVEPIDKPDVPRQRRRKNMQDTSTKWRDRTRRWSSWEVHEKPVPVENFEKNRMRLSKSAARKSVERSTRKDRGKKEGIHHATEDTISSFNNTSDRERRGSDGAPPGEDGDHDEDESMEDPVSPFRDTLDREKIDADDAPPEEDGDQDEDKSMEYSVSRFKNTLNHERSASDEMPLEQDGEDEEDESMGDVSGDEKARQIPRTPSTKSVADRGSISEEDMIQAKLEVDLDLST